MFGLFGKKKQGNRGEGAAHRTPRFIRGFAAAEVSRTLAAWFFDGGFSNAEIAGLCDELGEEIPFKPARGVYKIKMRF